MPNMRSLLCQIW